VKPLNKVKALSVLFAVSLFLAAFLGYGSYILQAENLRLKSELQSLSGSYHTLEAEHAELRGQYNAILNEYKLLNQSYFRLNQTFYALMRDYTELSLEYQDALSDYVELTVAYEELNQTYHELLQNYTKLEREAAGYTALLSEYQLLLANYTQLKENYDAFYATLYKPLPSKDKVVPTTEELKKWLKEDKTDEIRYSEPDFVCGDYAVMLHMHAKLKGWDMGVVAVLGKQGMRPFNHVFNAIECQEDLVYVEPQNDEIFYGPIEGTYYHPGFGLVQVREFIVVVLYDGA
jgi:predicted nuclease with TOPRIM domain